MFFFGFSFSPSVIKFFSVSNLEEFREVMENMVSKIILFQGQRENLSSCYQAAPHSPFSLWVQCGYYTLVSWDLAPTS